MALWSGAPVMTATSPCSSLGQVLKRMSSAEIHAAWTAGVDTME